MRFLVEPECENHGAGGLPVLLEEVLDHGQQSDEDVLAVAGAAAPQPLAVEMARERRVRPVRGVIDGDDVLVGGEEEWLAGSVGAIEGVDEAEAIDVVDAGLCMPGLG